MQIERNQKHKSIVLKATRYFELNHCFWNVRSRSLEAIFKVAVMKILENILSKSSAMKFELKPVI